MSRLQQQLAADLRRDQNAAWAILQAAATNLTAAEILEGRLREAGFAAAAQGHIDEHGCVALVFVQAALANVLAWLDHNAVERQAVSHVDTDHLAVHTYAVWVHGKEVSLAVCAQLDESRPS
jgi:hypothetical protein